MLVFKRRVEDVIRIGDNITIRVCSINGDKVRIGIEAPKHVSVHRQEVYDAIQNHRESE